jgi:hypothetical protein
MLVRIDKRVSTPPNSERCRRGATAIPAVGYAFGGGGSGDSTRDRKDDAILANALDCGRAEISRLSADGIATPAEQAAIAGQQFGTAVCSSGAESWRELLAP